MVSPLDLIDADLATDDPPKPAPAPAPKPAPAPAPATDPLSIIDRDLQAQQVLRAERGGGVAPGTPTAGPGPEGWAKVGQQAEAYGLAIPGGLAEGGEDLAHGVDVLGNKLGVVSDEKLEDVEQQQQELQQFLAPRIDPAHGIPIGGGDHVLPASDLQSLGNIAMSSAPGLVPFVGPEVLAATGGANAARAAQLSGHDPQEQFQAALANALGAEAGFRGVPLVPELSAAGKAVGGAPGKVLERAVPGAATGAAQAATSPQGPGNSDASAILSQALLSLVGAHPSTAPSLGEIAAAAAGRAKTPGEQAEAGRRALQQPGNFDPMGETQVMDPLTGEQVGRPDPSAVTREAPPVAGEEPANPAGQRIGPTDVELAKADQDQRAAMAAADRDRDEKALQSAAVSEQAKQEAARQQAAEPPPAPEVAHGRAPDDEGPSPDSELHGKLLAAADQVEADHQAALADITRQRQAGEIGKSQSAAMQREAEATRDQRLLDAYDTTVKEHTDASRDQEKVPGPVRQEEGGAGDVRDGEQAGPRPRDLQEEGPRASGPGDAEAREGGKAAGSEEAQGRQESEAGLAHLTPEAAAWHEKTAEPPTEPPPRALAKGDRPYDILDEIREQGGIRSKPARHQGGEYDDKPAGARRVMGGTLAPDEMAAALHRQGFGDGTVSRMWREMGQALKGRKTAATKHADPAPREPGADEEEPAPAEQDRDIADAAVPFYRGYGGAVPSGARARPSTGAGAKPGPSAPSSPARSPGTVAKDLLWGDKSFVGADVVPTAREAAATIKETAKDIRSTFAPHTAGDQAATMAGMAREHGADLAQRTDRTTAALAKARAFFAGRTPAENLDFVDRMETGRKQETPELEAIADTVRKVLDTKRDEIRALGTGKLEHWIEDYFPHLWKDPKKAADVFSQAQGKRPLEGQKAFLKKRTIPTTKEGIERGLEPVSDNPMDLVVLKAREMDKYLLGQRLIDEMKTKGLAQFVRATDKAPEGFAKIDDRIAQVYGPPTVTVSEYVDKATYDALDQALSKLSIAHERKASAGRGILGYSETGRSKIVTRGATDPVVIAHELGHQLDDKFGLGKLINAPELKKETAAIADLHGGKKSYFRKPEERTASAVEAYVRARQRMQEIAPKTFKVMDDFVANHPELESLRDVKPSLALQKLDFEKAHGGLLKLGEYYAPESAAQVLNNYLSPGLRGKAAFRAYLGAGNLLNQAQLGFSAFHLGFTSVDAATSRFAIALNHMADGHVADAAKAFGSVPVAPVTNLLLGDKVLKEWFQPGSQGGDIGRIVDGMKAAGGRAQMDSFYHTGAAQKMFDAFRAGNVVGGILRLPTGTIDLLSKPLMEWIVPRQKMGVFADMARRELAKLPPGADRDQVRAAMGKAWDSVDNRMGQVVYDNLFWQKSAKDLAMASVRSLGWNLGTIRELGGGALDWVKQGKQLALGKKPELTYRMAYTAAMPVVAGTLGAMMQYLLTGQGPQELKDYFFPKTGEQDANGHAVRLSLPSYMKDVFEYERDPVQTLLNKTHPLIGEMQEMFRNKDYYGTEIRHQDDPLVQQALQVAEYLGKQALPFGIRNAMSQSQQGGSTTTKALGFVGFPNAPHWLEQTKAEQLAQQISQDRRPQGARTQAEADKATGNRKIILELRSSDPTTRSQGVQDLNTGMRAGEISKAEAKNIHERATSTQLDYEIKHFDLDDAMRVWRASTADEKKEIRGILTKKVLDAKSTSIGTRKQYMQELRP